MSDIKRYDVSQTFYGDFSGMVQHAHGDWVKSEDVEDLEAKLSEAMQEGRKRMTYQELAQKAWDFEKNPVFQRPKTLSESSVIVSKYIDAHNLHDEVSYGDFVNATFIILHWEKVK